MVASENYQIRLRALELALAGQQPHEQSTMVIARAEAFRVFLTKDQKKEEASNG